MKNLRPLVVLHSFLTLGLVGCPGSLSNPEAFLIARDGGVDAGSELCAQDVVQTILSNETTCAGSGCHASDGPAAGLDLASPQLAERLLDAPGSSLCRGERQIDSSEPSNSLLYTKLAASPPCGGPMPLGQPLLSDEDQACVLAWIKDVVAKADPGGQDAGVDADAGPNLPPLCAQDVVQTIFANDARCSGAGCHATQRPAAGLDLASPQLAERLLDAPGSMTCGGERQIDSSEPSRSLLYTKLTAPPTCGGVMPPVGGRVSDEELACVLAWLENVVATANSGN